MWSVLINVPSALNVGFAFWGTVFSLSNRPNMVSMMFRYFISSPIYLSTCLSVTGINVLKSAVIVDLYIFFPFIPFCCIVGTNKFRIVISSWLT